MARLARLVIPGMPHHVTQGGNRRQHTFFNQADQEAYLQLMVEIRGLRRHGRTARPRGDEAFLDRLEGLIDRKLKLRKGGWPRKHGNQ